MLILWKLFDYVAANKWAQWTLAILSGLFVYKLYERARDNRIRKQERTKVIDKIEAKEDQLKEAANEAENRITADLNSRSLRDVAANSPENLGPVRRD